jgi:hypothetical protein
MNYSWREMSKMREPERLGGGGGDSRGYLLGARRGDCPRCTTRVARKGTLARTRPRGEQGTTFHANESRHRALDGGFGGCQPPAPCLALACELLGWACALPIAGVGMCFAHRCLIAFADRGERSLPVARASSLCVAKRCGAGVAYFFARRVFQRSTNSSSPLRTTSEAVALNPVSRANSSATRCAFRHRSSSIRTGLTGVFMRQLCHTTQSSSTTIRCIAVHYT